MLWKIEKSPSHQVTRTPVNWFKAVVLCFLSGLILALSLNNGKFWIFSWFGFLPLFITLKNKSRFQAFWLSYLTGIVFWLGTIYWLVHVTLLGLILLILYLAMYFGIFGLLFSAMDYGLWTMDLLYIPSVWVILEYVRSHLFTGFGWALLGYSQYLNLSVIQIADITGIWGVSFLVMMANVVIKEVLGLRSWVLGKRKQIIFMIISCFLFISATIIYGYYRMYQTPNTQHQTPIKISVIQGNISQELKWDPKSKDFIIDRYLTLTSQAVKDNPDLIVWPEAAMPVVLEDQPLYYERISNFIEKMSTPLLLGAVTSRDNLYYNSAILVSIEGRQLNRYDKLYLVPFGEYIPLRKILWFLETIVPIGDFTRGKEYTILKIPNPPAEAGSRKMREKSKIQNNFAVLICFEDIFPELSRRFVNRGARFLINITNDAWFKKSTAAYQHLQASVFRAIENRVFLVRAANTGISGYIAPSGRIISLVQDKSGRNIFISGYDTKEVITYNKNLSFYTRYGDVFIFLLFIFIVYNLLNHFLTTIRKGQENGLSIRT